MSKVQYVRCKTCSKEAKMVGTGFMDHVRAPEGWETQQRHYKHIGLCNGSNINRHFS